jgi:hypothetical protein
VIRTVTIHFIGGPEDGDGMLDLIFPGADLDLLIETVHLEDHPEGCYHKSQDDGKYYWRLF